MNHLFYLTTWCRRTFVKIGTRPVGVRTYISTIELDKAENKRYHVNYIFPSLHLVFMLIEG